MAESKSPLLPATYRVGRGNRVAVAFAGLFVIGIGVWFLCLVAGLLRGPGFADKPARIMVGAIGVAAVGLGIFLLMFLWRAVTIADQYIESSGIGWRKRLSITEIAGYRGEDNRLNFYDATDKLKLSVAVAFKIDDRFAAWLSRFPDLIEQRAQHELKEELAALDLGETADERAVKLEKARRTARWLSYVALASLLPFMVLQILPRTALELLSICLLIEPPVAIWLVNRGRGLYRVFPKRGTKLAPVGVLLVFPAMGLFAIGTTLISELMSPRVVFAPAIAGGFGLFAVAFAAVPEIRRWGAAVGYALMFTVHAFGGMLALNAFADTAPPQTFESSVLGKQMHSGDKSTSFFLDLAPWGPVKEKSRRRVTHTIYWAVNAGDKVEIDLQPGFLGWQHLTIRAVPSAQPSAVGK